MEGSFIQLAVRFLNGHEKSFGGHPKPGAKLRGGEGGFNAIGVKHKLMNMLTLPRRGRIRIFIN